MKAFKQFLKNFLPWSNPERRIMTLYKKSRKHYLDGRIWLSNYYSFLIYRRWHCVIPGSAEIADDLFLPHPLGVVIGAGVKIGKKCTIYQGVTIGWSRVDVPGYPTIGDEVVVYANSVIAGKISVGDKSVIGCNSSIFKSVKENITVGGLYK